MNSSVFDIRFELNKKHAALGQRLQAAEIAQREQEQKLRCSSLVAPDDVTRKPVVEAV